MITRIKPTDGTTNVNLSDSIEFELSIYTDDLKLISRTILPMTFLDVIATKHEMQAVIDKKKDWFK